MIQPFILIEGNPRIRNCLLHMTVYCDKAYISRRNVQFIADVDAYPAIEPKSTSSINSKSHWADSQLMREYRADPEEWKRACEYRRKSLVETVFSMMKLRYGGILSSRGGWRGEENC